jgi:hypothetical protein
MGKSYNVVVEQGSTFFLSMSISNQEGYILDIKECLAIMQIRALENYESEKLFDCTPYMVFTSDNRILIEVPGDVTSTFKWTSGFYDIRLKEVHTNRIYKILEGTVLVKPRVSDNIWSKAARYTSTCTLPKDI